MAGTSIICLNCGRKFVWSYEQQRHYRERGWNQPKRCPDCRSLRRYEGQSGMRGLVGPPTAPHAPGEWRLADPPLGAPPPVPRWHDLSRAMHYRHLSQFLQLDPAAMAALTVPEFALLAQWIFEQHDLATSRLVKRDGRLDLELVHHERAWHEFARFYLEAYESPADLAWDLSGKLKNSLVKRIHLCTLGTFTAAQKRVGNDFSASLDFVEGKDLRRWLREAQQLCRARLVGQRRAP